MHIPFCIVVSITAVYHTEQCRINHQHLLRNLHRNQHSDEEQHILTYKLCILDPLLVTLTVLSSKFFVIQSVALYNILDDFGTDGDCECFDLKKKQFEHRVCIAFSEP